MTRANGGRQKDRQSMAELPQRFLVRIRQQLGTEYDAFLASYEQECCAGLRVNTGKLPAASFAAMAPFSLEPVPWTSNGFYYDREEATGITTHPYYYAGLFYMQEPSAMLPAQVLPIEPGDRVLDLCAAPGGKTTELASKLEGTGFLVANDASASRAKALVKNLALWGCTNSCITAETPQRLLDAFGCSFDKILVDAPCSGEGMFRKDQGLIASWQEQGPPQYAARQKEILDCAVQMLRPGGLLLYSTCTFSLEENEQVLAWALETYPELALEDPVLPGKCLPEGFAHGMAPCEKALRIWPHRVRGEGHFLALLRKRKAQAGDIPPHIEEGLSESAALDGAMPHDAERPKKPERKKQKLDSNDRKRNAIPEEVRVFLELLPEALWKEKCYRQLEDTCLLLPPDVLLPPRLRFLRTGLWIGTLKKGRFEPSQALALVLCAQDYQNSLRLSCGDVRVVRYLKGETIDLLPEEEAVLCPGWVLVCVDGFGLGWGKRAGAALKNKYYPGWRMQ